MIEIPYHVAHHGSVWQVVKDSDGKVLGTHKSKKEAIVQIYAITMSEKKKK